MDRRAIVQITVAAVLGVLFSVLLWTQLGPGDAPREVRGLVSLSPPITETLYALGAGDQLVGRSDWCEFPEQASSLPAVGSALAPDHEAIARLAPQRILSEQTNASRPEDLSRLGEVSMLPWLTLDDVLSSTAKLGVLTGHVSEAEALINRLRQRLDVPLPANSPSALLVLGGSEIGHGDVWFVRRDSIHGAAMNAAGVRNAVDRDVRGAPALSPEALVRLDPEIIIVLLGQEELDDEGRAEVIDAWSVYPGLQAVQEGRVGVIHGAGLMSTGPRVLDFVDVLAGEVGRLDSPG